MLTARSMLTARCLCAVVILMTVTVGYAQDKEGFSGQVGLGLLATSGNSDNESVNANLDLWWNYELWSHSLNGAAIRADTSGVTTAEAISLAWKSKYAFSDSNYLFGLVNWDRDEFSAYDQQLRETIGYGRRLIDTEQHVLNLEIGAGARQADLRDGSSQNDTIVYLGGDYRWAISETSEFTQTLSVEHSSDNTYIETNSSLSAKVRENLALIISFAVKNNSDVLPGTEKTDTFTTVSLSYAF